MYLFVCQSILELCGARSGEGIIREAVRRAGGESGYAQRKRLLEAGLKTNLHSLYHCARDYMEDPRVRCNQIFDEEERQIWEIYTCPLADYWNKRNGSKIGSFYCEEYQSGRIAAFTDGIGQVNLSKLLTCSRDNFCRFSVYFREANMPVERAKEAFAHCDSEYTEPEHPPADVSFDEGISNLTILTYYYLLEVAEERFGQEGVCAIMEGLKKWSAEAITALRTQADHTLMPLNLEFVELNFPLSLNTDNDSAWKEHSGHSACKLMKNFVLDSIAAALDT